MHFKHHAICVFALALLAGACGGGSPTTPTPPNPNPNPNPPANAVPVVESITIQGRRAGQPARFADLQETIDVRATVTDAETPVGELTYQWSATAGSFSGTGSTVTWTAPDSATTPGTVTITLKVVENYGHPGQAKIYSHEVTRTQTLALHNSADEIAKMAVAFLTKFSQPQAIKDWRDVMQDFDVQGGTCPDPDQIESERGDVERHYQNYVMNSYSIGAANVSVAFRAGCDVPGRTVRPGDACAAVPVIWNSTGPDGTGTTSGMDYISAAYSASASRWWLCSSDYIPATTIGAGSFYAR